MTITLTPQFGSGSGRLIRRSNAVLYAAGDVAAASALVGWCRISGAKPAAELIRELANLAEGASSLGPFCAVAIDGDSWHVLSSGGVPAVARGDSGAQPILSDGRVAVYRSLSSLEVLVGDGALDHLLVLDDGVIAADGFSLRVSAQVAPWSTPHTASDEQPLGIAVGTHRDGYLDPAEAAETAGPDDEELIDQSSHVDTSLETPGPEASAPALPTLAAPSAAEPSDDLFARIDELTTSASSSSTPAAQPAAAVPEPSAARIMVQGVSCQHGHFNDPLAPTCRICGTPIGLDSARISGPRPALGELVMSDGASFLLHNSLVFGRDPSDDVEVRSGRAQGVTLVDPGNTISRVHAEIRADGWQVYIVDRGSTNGTFIWAADQQQWLRLSVDQQVALPAGSHVSFGRLTGTFESLPG
jgi:hypothetical protein